jgi:hypothetical protein
MDSYVERSEVRVLGVLADLKGGGPAEAMQKLESKLSSIKGRRFYGVFRILPGGEEYFACVEKVAADNPAAMGLEEGVIPGGLFVRRKVFDWAKVIAGGKLPSVYESMVRHYHVDRGRPDVEYYRSMTELHLLIPVESQAAIPLAWEGVEP